MHDVRHGGGQFPDRGSLALSAAVHDVLRATSVLTMASQAGFHGFALGCSSLRCEEPRCATESVASIRRWRLQTGLACVPITKTAKAFALAIFAVGATGFEPATS